MKKYPNINKYLNRTPRGYLLFLLIGHIFVWGGLFLWFLQEPELRIIDKLLFLAFVVGTTLIPYSFYRNQVTLKKARLGKHLRRYYHLKGDELVAQIDAIEEEVGRPLYADVSRSKKYNAFFITENWLVGTDGTMLMRANACKKADIVQFDMGVEVKIRKGTSYIYHTLVVTDKNQYTYRFWLRSEENLATAYNQLVDMQKEE